MRARYLVLALIGILVLSILLRQPSNDRDWSPDQETLSYGIFEGELVHLFNVRNFTYRSVDEYDVRFYNATYNLSAIATADYVVEPFSAFAGIAHTFITFGFEDGKRVAISVEIRKEKGERFSTVRGVLREYELMYVIGDERDLIKLRTNFRRDKVYLYPLTMDPGTIRELFIDMVEKANDLTGNPEFYNTLTQSCSVNIFKHFNSVSSIKVPASIKLILPGYSDRYLYDINLIDTTLSWEETRKAHQINEQAQLYADDPGFSEKIRRPVQ